MTVKRLCDAVLAVVPTAALLYHRLVLVVGPPRSGKTTALQHLARIKGWPLLNVNLLLCERLLELTRKQRAVRVPKLLGAIVQEAGADVVLLDDLEVLFSTELAQDPRLLRLQKLAGVEMMPAQQLRDFENRLFGLKTCFSLTRQDLEAEPICPHCRYRPVEESADGLPAADVLEHLDEQLDRMVAEWTQTLLGNLEDPTVKGNIDLVAHPKGKQALGAFLDSRELPDPVDNAFVKALQEVLRGLQKVVVTPEALREALLRGGVPCTVHEFEDRFKRYVAELTKGKDPSAIRIVVE